MDKHTAIRMVDEGNTRVLKDHNSQTSYGPIRKGNSNGAARNASSSTGLTRKNVKSKKNEQSNQEFVVVSDWVPNLSKSLVPSGTISRHDGSSGSGDSVPKHGMRWTDNVAYVGEQNAKAQ
ncbi:hypothetical protein V6N13_142709 [Hibiscus sabdariffa]|uniref:Uncharacterized protein n=1 Tax=Hibiscus sabdariffa TaxID=183260 RepID=A0ABR2FF00_9ROSI